MIVTNFITKLPRFQRQHDSILVIVNRMKNLTLILLVKTTHSAEDCAKLYIKEVVRLYVVPNSIISDRGAQFIEQLLKFFKKSLCSNVNVNYAFHP